MAEWPDDVSESLDVPPTLFAPGQARALLTAAAITLQETGELDEERAARIIAEGKPIERVPQRLRPSSRFGVQLLVDWGSRMQPYRSDQRELLADLRRTVGAHRVEVLRFQGTPHVAGPGTPRTWQPYHPPSAGTVVLILGELGLGRSDDTEAEDDCGTSDWVAWGRSVRAAGAHPVALVPHGPRRWPESLRQQITLIHWDRSTTVGVIRSSRRTHVRRYE